MRQIWDSKFIVEKRETLIQCQKSYNIWSYAAILADKICKELKQSQRLSCNMILVSLMWNCLFLRIQLKPQCCFPPSAKKKPQSLISLFSVSLFFCHELILFPSFSHECFLNWTLYKALLSDLFLDYKPIHFLPSRPNPVWQAHLSWPKQHSLYKVPLFTQNRLALTTETERDRRLRRRENLSLWAMMWFSDISVQY